MLLIARCLLVLLFGLGSVAGALPGEVARGFEPPHHYGIDVAVPDLSVVSAVLPGHISFAGEVADVLTVTVDHGGGVKTSYSFLHSVSVTTGQFVASGHAVGRASGHKGVTGFHLSLRLNGVYTDPTSLFLRVAPHKGLRLISPPSVSSHNLT